MSSRDRARAQHQRVVVEARVAPQPHGERRHVQRGLALLLQLAAVDAGAVLEHDLGHGVGERSPRGARGEDLDDPGFAAAARHDQRARVRGGAGWARAHVLDADRGFEDRAGGDQQDGRVAGEGGVELGERAGRAGRDTAEPRLEASGTRRKSVAQAQRRDARLARVEARQLARQPPVDEHEPQAARIAGRQQRQHVGLGPQLRIGRLEAAPRERRQGRVTPGLVARGRQARLHEARERGGATLAQPRGLGCRLRGERQALEGRAVGVLLRADGAHQRVFSPAAAGSFSSQE